VRAGRRREFEAFGWQADPPDPQDEATFLGAKLDRALRETGLGRVLPEFYRELIRLRKEIASLAQLSKKHLNVAADYDHRILYARRRAGSDEAFLIFGFNSQQVAVPVPLPEGRWKKILDSADQRWLGPGSLLPEEIESNGRIELTVIPHAFAVLRKEDVHGEGLEVIAY